MAGSVRWQNRENLPSDADVGPRTSTFFQRAVRVVLLFFFELWLDGCRWEIRRRNGGGNTTVLKVHYNHLRN